MDFVPRSSFGWPATAANRAHPTLGLVVHYDGSDQGLAGKPHSACVDYWKRTRLFHMHTRGWLDIGYSFGACPHGMVLEGRGLDREQAAQPGGNTTWYSVTLMSGPGEHPTDKQITAVRELRAWLIGKGLAAAVRGHRDFVSTDCPGSVLYGMVHDGTFAKSTPGGWPGRYLKYTAGKPLMHGSDVRWVQERLGVHGHHVTVDGQYGPKTAAAVKSFQTSSHLSADGVVGPNTWGALAHG
jgi:hypothetical protein